MKRILKAALIFFIIGVLFLGVGLAFGGSIQSDGTRHWYGNRIFIWPFSQSRYDYDTQMDFIGAPNGDLESITSLELSLGEGRYVISPATDINPAYSVSADSRYKVESFISGGRYSLDIKTKHRLYRTSTPVTSIYLPIDTYYDQIIIEVGAGTLDIPSLTAEALYLEAGMGTMSVGSLTGKMLDIDVGMGTMDIGTVDTDTLSLEVGMGTASIGLADAWEQYGYDFSCGLGSISVNDRSFISGIGQSSRSGARMLYANIGMGTAQFFAGK